MSEHEPQPDPQYISPEFLWEKIKSKSLLSVTAETRRRVIEWLDSDTTESLSSYKLAEYFGVSSTQIRKDRAVIAENDQKQLSPEESLRFVNDYLQRQRLRIRQAEQGLQESEPGTQIHIMYLRLLSDLEKRTMSILQEVAVVPKELGNLNVTEEIWEAVISQDGIPSVHQVDTSKPAQSANGDESPD